MHIIEICSVLFGLPDRACCRKQDSLMRDGLRTSTLRAINYTLVKIVDVTPPVIDPKAIL